MQEKIKINEQNDLKLILHFFVISKPLKQWNIKLWKICDLKGPIHAYMQPYIYSFTLLKYSF